MPDVLKVNERVEILVTELMWRFSRSSGPGGQSVNTSDSKVELSFDVANSSSIPSYLRKRAVDRLNAEVLVVTASEHRSQFQNRRAAERRLIEILADALKPSPPPRRATKPTKASKQRRLDGKKRKSEVKRNRQTPNE